jgi:hemerythrin-like metal-binding protein
MAIAYWQSEYDTGYSEVDAQHHTLIDLINQLADAISQQKSTAELGKILQLLLDDTKSHFKYEQNMMANLSYSGYLNHRASHDVLENELFDILGRFQSDPSYLDLKTVEILKNSLIEHIVEKDIPMTKDLKTLQS